MCHSIMQCSIGGEGNEISWNLDDVIESLASHDGEQFSQAVATLKIGNKEIKSPALDLDVKVKVLAQWIVSAYYTPDMKAAWPDPVNARGLYEPGTYPGGLEDYHLSDALASAIVVEGIGLDGTTVVRVELKTPVAGFSTISTPNGPGYLEYPSSEQKQGYWAAVLSHVSVAVTKNNPDLTGGDQLYILGLAAVGKVSVRRVDDTGSLHGENKHVVVWWGVGGHALQHTTNVWGTPKHTILKFLE